MTGATPGPAAPREVEVTEEPTALYRFYDASGTLLYVGITRNLAARWAQHEADKYWWPEVARKTVMMYGSRREAELAEGRAIRSESPVHNKAMGRRDKTDPKLPVIARKSREVMPIGRPASFTLCRNFLTRIDAYAGKHNCSRGAAFSVLLLTGIVTHEQEEKLPLEEQLAAMEARRRADRMEPAA